MTNKGMMPQQGGGLNNMAGSPGGPSDPSTFNLGAPPQGHGPPGSGPSFNPGTNRMKMMPPPAPSPNMNGPKDQNGGPGGGGPNNPNGKNQNQGQGGGNNSDGSPRNQPPNVGNNGGQTPNTGGTGPPTPGPQQNHQQQQQQQQNQGPGPGQNIAPSPLLGGPPSLGPDSLSSNIFSTDFIQSVASSLDEFDPAIFRPDGDINFERDFGQWFNQDAMGGGSLDTMK
jgi:collagen type III alpha